MLQSNTKRTKVLIIASKLRIGGAEKVAADIGFNADKEKFEIHYLVFGEKVEGYETELFECGCKVVHIPEPSESFVNYLKTLKKIISENQYNVIHAHTMFNIGWAMLLGKLCGVPVRIAHSHSQLLEKRNIKTCIYETIMRFLILTCSTDLVACGNAAGERLYGKRAFKKKGQLILNGIDCKSFVYCDEKRIKIRSQFGLEDAFIIGHAGHLAQVKNQSFLIDLMPDILKKVPNALLLLLGDGADKTMLEEEIKDLVLTNNVKMTGNVRNVSDYLSAMDVFAFPSLYEGMPLTLLEAQANGLPCVVSDRVPRDVFVTELVKTVHLEDKEAWVSALISAKRPLNNSSISSKFDVSNAMNIIYEIYEK